MERRSDLPQDLLSNILVRLPVKSLIRFKCVERSWDALFKTPTFVNSHRTHLQMHRHEELFMISHRPCSRTCGVLTQYRRLSIISDSHSQSEVQLDYLFPEFESRRSLDEGLSDIALYGHCNGVFCLYVSYREGHVKLILWNPATREVKDVPPPPHMPSHDHYLRYWESTSPSVHQTLDVFRGFGGVPNSNELKLVNLVIDHNNKLHPPSAELYNLSTNSWTLISNDTIPVNAINLWPQKVSHVIKGVCYWLNAIDVVGDPAFLHILCFDFCNNQFRALKPPPTGSPYAGKPYCKEFVTEFNDSIAYVTHRYDRSSLEAGVWILEQDSWTKKYNFGPFEGYGDRIFAIWKGGTELLGAPFDGDVQVYSPNGKSGHHFEAESDNPVYVRKYEESIAPLSF